MFICGWANTLCLLKTHNEVCADVLTDQSQTMSRSNSDHLQCGHGDAPTLSLLSLLTCLGGHTSWNWLHMVQITSILLFVSGAGWVGGSQENQPCWPEKIDKWMAPKRNLKNTFDLGTSRFTISCVLRDLKVSTTSAGDDDTEARQPSPVTLLPRVTLT